MMKNLGILFSILNIVYCTTFFNCTTTFESDSINKEPKKFIHDRGGDLNAIKFYQQNGYFRMLRRGSWLSAGVFIFDQLSNAHIYETAIPHSHVRNIFVKDRKFYSSELGISPNATFNNTTVAEMYFMGAIDDSTLYEFQHVRYICGKKLSPQAMSVLQSSFHNNGLNVKIQTMTDIQNMMTENKNMITEIQNMMTENKNMIANMTANIENMTANIENMIAKNKNMMANIENMIAEIQTKMTKNKNIMTMEYLNMTMWYQWMELRNQKSDISSLDVGFLTLVCLLLIIIKLISFKEYLFSH